MVATWVSTQVSFLRHIKTTNGVDPLTSRLNWKGQDGANGQGAYVQEQDRLNNDGPQTLDSRDLNSPESQTLSISVSMLRPLSSELGTHETVKARF